MEEKLKKIYGFGEKIGGARREIYAVLASAKVDCLNEDELKVYITRDKIWPAFNAVKEVEKGADPFLLFWKREIRKMVWTYPMYFTNEEKYETAREYLVQVQQLMDAVNKIRSKEGIKSFYDEVSAMPLDKCINKHELRFSQRLIPRWEYKCKRTKFGSPKEKKNSATRKKRFCPPSLLDIEREGKDYRKGMQITPELWQKHFSFRGVEFGNWLSEDDRRASLNYAFDALKDLACILQIDDLDIALNGSLALAFGSRGIANAAAHYEPLRKVINLTKLNGAGSTAHEWCHAVDHAIGKFYGITDAELASESKEKHKLPSEFNVLIDSLKYINGKPTCFYRDSIFFDKNYSKSGFGYWTSSCEMMARAFSCYVQDKAGFKSDYLFAHSEVHVLFSDKKLYRAYPTDEERILYNQYFDVLIKKLVNDGFFHIRRNTCDLPIVIPDDKRNDTIVHDPDMKLLSLQLKNDPDGQLSFLL